MAPYYIIKNLIYFAGSKKTPHQAITHSQLYTSSVYQTLFTQNLSHANITHTMIHALSFKNLVFTQQQHFSQEFRNIFIINCFFFCYQYYNVTIILSCACTTVFQK